MDENLGKEIKLAMTFESMTVSGFGLLAIEFGLSKLEILKEADEIRAKDPRTRYQTPSFETINSYLKENLNAEFVNHTEELDKLYFEKSMTENKITLILIERLEKRFNKKLSEDLKEVFKPETLIRESLGLSTDANTNDKIFRELLEWLKS